MTEQTLPTDTPGRPRLAWIGTGIMGGTLCGHLLDAGYELVVSNRTRARADALVERGARWADSPAEAAAGADVVFTMVGYPDDVREVVLGQQGTLGAVADGATLVDLTTSDPALAVEIAERAGQRGVASLDAPVSGGDVGAQGGTLAIMVGGDGDALARVHPLLDLFASSIAHQGGPGAGQHTKMANQILVASATIGVCEALLYAHRAGLDLVATIGAVTDGAGRSWALEHLGPRIAAGDLEPGFIAEHLLKDLRIALDEARRLDLSLPGLTLAEQLYAALVRNGHARSGTQALVDALATVSGVHWPTATD